MTERVVLCMVIDGKATLYEQTDVGAEAFSTLKAPHHFDEHRAMAWALGTLSVLALDEVHETNGRETNGHVTRALPSGDMKLPSTNGVKRRATRVPPNEWPAVDVLRLIEQTPGLTRVELREMTGLDVKKIGNRLTQLTKNRLVRRSTGINGTSGRYYPVRRDP